MSRASSGDAGQQNHVLNEFILLGNAVGYAQAGIRGKPGNLLALGHNDGLAESHQPDRDARGLSGRRMPQVDAGVRGRGQQPEIIIRRVADADGCPSRARRGATARARSERQTLPRPEAPHRRPGGAPHRTHEAQPAAVWIPAGIPEQRRQTSAGRCPSTGEAAGPLLPETSGGGAKRCGTSCTRACRRMPQHHARGSRIVDDHGAREPRRCAAAWGSRSSGNPPGVRPGLPERRREAAIPLAVVEDELLQVIGPLQASQKEVMQHGIVRARRRRAWPAPGDRSPDGVGCCRCDRD